MTTAIGDRQLTIIRAVTRTPGDVPENTVVLWECLATELTGIIGDIGFQSLYNRSLHKTQVSFPWLGSSLPKDAVWSKFSDLTTSLQTRDPAEAGQASIMLLNTFVSILSALVGEILTTSILDAALGADGRGTTSKELNNE